jgi:hypothetical protein
MALASGDPLPTIPEGEAIGAIKATYENIKAVIGVPVVNLIFRHIATLPGGLEWAWSMLRPLYAAGELVGAASRLMADIELPPLPRLARSALRAVGVDAEGERSIGQILDAYNRSNPMNMIALSTLLTFLEGTKQTYPPLDADADTTVAGGDLPATSEELPPLCSLEDMDEATATLVRLLNGLGAQGQARTMASMYRHLAHWPGYLALALTLLQPLHANGCLQAATERARNRAAVLARGMVNLLGVDSAPSPLPEEPRLALESALRYFTANLIVEMLPVGKLLRTTLSEPPLES